MKKKNKVIALGLAAAMTAASISGCGTTPAERAAEVQDPDEFYMTIKFSNVFQPSEWNYKASEYLAQIVEERTEGHIKIEYYGQGQLDCYDASVEQAHYGSVWMGLEEPSYFADYIGDYNILVGPMLYTSDAEYNEVMGSDIVKKSERASG